MPHAPITATEACALFARWQTVPVLVVAVSGGPDSVALLWLLARWRRALANGPYLVAATIDHGLRANSASEARDVKRLAATLGVPHVTKRWTGDKPATGLPAAARHARYDLLAKVARVHKAQHVLTAHTQDDQAETVLMRLLRGSGLIGLTAMQAETARGDVTIVRPLLTIPKARLVATLRDAGIAFADDPTNRDEAFTRPRLRALLPMLDAEGLSADTLARLATRLQRADAALAAATDTARQDVALPDQSGFDAPRFVLLPAEIRLRLLQSAIAAMDGDDRVELNQVETLLAAIAAAPQPRRNGLRLRRTLGGALVTLTATRLLIARAPPRRTTAKSSPP